MIVYIQWDKLIPTNNQNSGKIIILNEMEPRPTVLAYECSNRDAVMPVRRVCTHYPPLNMDDLSTVCPI